MPNKEKSIIEYSDRIVIPLRPEQKELLKKAAKAKHRSMSSFYRDVLVSAAQRAIREAGKENKQ